MQGGEEACCESIICGGVDMAYTDIIWTINLGRGRVSEHRYWQVGKLESRAVPWSSLLTPSPPHIQLRGWGRRFYELKRTEDSRHWLEK